LLWFAMEGNCWSFVSIRNQLKPDNQTRAICRLCSLPVEIRYARENDRGCVKTGPIMKFVFFIASELTMRVFPPYLSRRYCCFDKNM
jgi:hypothetical protein